MRMAIRLANLRKMSKKTTNNLSMRVKTMNRNITPILILASEMAFNSILENKPLYLFLSKL